MRSTLIVGYVAAILSLFSLRATAEFNDPISFSQAGRVNLWLVHSVGGFDHILELADSNGPIGTPVMVLTDVFNPSTDVLGYTPAALFETVTLGRFAAGEEIVFRLSNIESTRFGDVVGELDSQIFSGSSNALNPNPLAYYTYVQENSPTEIVVGFEDLFGIDPNAIDPRGQFIFQHDVSFVLTLVVPEPSSLGLALFGTVVAGISRRRAV